MNRAVPSQDSSPESFARLLNRLTRSPGSHSSTLDPLADSLVDSFEDRIHDPLADEHSVRVSISRDAAALNGNRKRTMAPVRASRSAAEASEISYEHALRQHGRSRPTSLPDPPTLPPQEEKISPANRAQAEAKALSALRQAKAAANEAKSTSKPAVAAAPESQSPAAKPSSATGASARTNSRRKAQTKKGASPRAEDSDQKSVAQSSGPARPSPARKATKAEQASSILDGSAASTSKSAATKPHRRSRDRSARQNSIETISPAVPSATSSNSLELELASHPAALEQRQSIVSIRLSAIESEQLRQRAAESGISVSAYMRSCVLEAEHLRAQVKQALAELRAPHALTAMSQLEPPSTPLFSPVYTPAEASVRTIRPGLMSFLSGVFAVVLGRFHR